MKKTIKISGMSCNQCVKSVTKAIKALPVEAFRVNINLLEVEFKDSKVTLRQIERAITDAGYEVVSSN